MSKNWNTQGLKCCNVSLPAATKLGQGNVFTGVCDSVHGGGVSASVHAGMPPPPPQSRHPQSRHPLGQTPPWEQTPPEQTPPPGKQTPAYGQRAAGTHPTGMHSCLWIIKRTKTHCINDLNHNNQDV